MRGTKTALDNVTAESARGLVCQKRGQPRSDVCPCMQNVMIWKKTVCSGKKYIKKANRISQAARAASLAFTLQMVFNLEAQVCLCTC